MAIRALILLLASASANHPPKQRALHPGTQAARLSISVTGEAAAERPEVMRRSPEGREQGANVSFIEIQEAEVKELPEVGKVLVRMDGDSPWVLLMKLSHNKFCHGSGLWTDGNALKPEKMLNKEVPAFKEYDAKSIAFHKLKGINAVKLQTNAVSFKDAPEVHFKQEDTAETLMTTNKVDILPTGGFNSQDYWKKWENAFGNARDRAPAFMRAGKFVTNPKPQCRKNPASHPSGCGKLCVFCMQAGDGHGCPVNSAHNDISSGLGLSSAFCGGGAADKCSTSGIWSGTRSTLVWGRLKELPKKEEEKSSTLSISYGIASLLGCMQFLLH